MSSDGSYMKLSNQIDTSMSRHTKIAEKGSLEVNVKSFTRMVAEKEP